MLVAKQVADLLTASRAFLGLYLIWLGFSGGTEGLPLAVWVLIAAWTSDCLDGPIARRSGFAGSTWIGDHDLEADITVSIGLMFYLLVGGFVSPWMGAFYCLVWILVILRYSLPRSLGMLFQAPIYGWFIWIANVQVPEVGRWLLVWIFVIVVLTWPRFPKEVVPGFLVGFRDIMPIHRRGE